MFVPFLSGFFTSFLAGTMIALLLATVSTGDLVFVIIKFYETLISHIIGKSRSINEKTCFQREG